MIQLYKYSEYLGLEYFDNPTIILSVPSKLNDPFESNLSEDIINHISKNINNKEAFNQNVKWTFTNYLNLTGIVSLSETSRNILMWSHYAKHHKGMCIGLSKDFLKHKSDLKYHFAQGFNISSSTEPQKVNYDNKRFEESEHEDLSVDELLSGQAIDNYLHRHLMIKSDEWIYEKEHRLIIPLAFSDLIMDVDLKSNPKLHSLVESGLNDKEINIINNDKQKRIFEIKKPELSNMFITIACNDEYQNANGIIFLLKINPKDILTLHFGHRFCDDEIKRIIQKISDPNHPLNHVKIFKKKISSTRFELEVDKLYPSM